MALVTPSQAARIANRSESTIRYWISRKWISVIRVPAYGYGAIDLEELEGTVQWLREEAERRRLNCVPPHRRRPCIEEVVA